MLKKPIIYGLIVVIIMISLQGCASAVSNNDIVKNPLADQKHTFKDPSQSKKTSPQLAQDIKVYDLIGQESTFHIDEKHPVLFFATWCSHCQSEIPQLYKINRNNNLTYIEVFSKTTSDQTVLLAEETKQRALDVKNFIAQYKADPDESEYYLIKDDESTLVSSVVTLFFVENGKLASMTKPSLINEYVKSHNKY